LSERIPRNLLAGTGSIGVQVVVSKSNAIGAAASSGVYRASFDKTK
jgi:hypothetical protein